jgi:Outer membrane protein beta-barrel domain
MKKLPLTFCAMAAFASAAFAGPEYSGKEMKQVAPPPCPQWYADNEFNIDLWGTYLFTGNDWGDDRYFESDHAWGGGIDVKYFFRRYFGVGIEGWVVDARRAFETVTIVPPPPGFVGSRTEFGNGHEDRTIGSVLGTFTLRYPISCSRFAPYVWVGGGAIFGGGEREELRVNDVPAGAFLARIRKDGRTEAIGQFGGGIEIRITPHIGWMNDFSWNVVDGPDNDFGMVRSGITFAF